MFPFDFGFVPSTVGGDGDPLDAIVLLDHAVPVGCVLTVRPIGVIEARQRKKSGKWVRNDRLLCIPTHAYARNSARTLHDLHPDVPEQLEGFFAHYNDMRGKQFRVISKAGPKKAAKLIERARRAFRTG